jgi:hypothetical protein
VEKVLTMALGGNKAEDGKRATTRTINSRAHIKRMINSVREG